MNIPREREIQEQLDLGATDEIRSAVLARRSNVKEYRYDDMSRTSLPESHFDVVNAVEVLEHVEDDEAFVANVARVLRSGGHFVMTTPNGDFKPVPYPDVEPAGGSGDRRARPEEQTSFVRGLPEVKSPRNMPSSACSN
jgi:SAM-dependent methyltransferase